MKTLEIVVKNAELARAIAAHVKVEIVSEKLISKCTLIVLKGSFDKLMDFNDEMFFETNPAVHANYLKEIMA
ncbi:hypothetical protein PP427_gp293 [Salmonella phage KM16]|uniref:hypothetical protein n=1 Tax=Salmonella phage KM16 TaxID=2797303 RepID=UPI0024914988|nr:hypothetical protein PP427_gp293 [Salmonella phage KM16]